MRAIANNSQSGLIASLLAVELATLLGRHAFEFLCGRKDGRWVTQERSSERLSREVVSFRTDNAKMSNVRVWEEGGRRVALY
jgi:hypothetical protein